MRVNDELVEILREFREKASAVGVKQFIIQTHFQTPLEVTPEAEEAIRKILSAGWLITNQLVYTVAASRRGHTTRLRQVLNSLGVVCYYTFSVKGFQENYAVFTPNSRSMQEQQEEKLFGRMTAEQTAELDAALRLNDALHDAVLLELRTSFNNRLKALENLVYSLLELRLIRVALLYGFVHALQIRIGKCHFYCPPYILYHSLNFRK